MEKYDQFIRIIGARHHNLKGITVSIPVGKITAITGPSGAGKSSLAVDCIFSQAKARYLHALGIEGVYPEFFYKPDLGLLEHALPPVALWPRQGNRNPRSTVASISGIAWLLRLLFSFMGVAHCPKCGLEVRGYNQEQMLDSVSSLPPGSRLVILAPVLKDGTQLQLDSTLELLRQKGFLRIRLNGSLCLIEDVKDVHCLEGFNVEVVIDRVTVRSGIMPRLADSLRQALEVGNGRVMFGVQTNRHEEMQFFAMSEETVCLGCNERYPVLSPRLFSPKNRDMVCPKCHGSAIGCGYCQGTGLGPYALSVMVEERNIASALSMSIKEFGEWLGDLKNNLDEGWFWGSCGRQALEAVLGAFGESLQSLMEMGLGYLQLGRPVTQISLGELQRLYLTNLLLRRMTGILYILDEPSADLDPAQVKQLVKNIKRLRNQGNTVVLVEHNLRLIENSDYIIELGPGAGEKGGNILFAGSVPDLLNSPESITRAYLTAPDWLSRRGGNTGSTNSDPFARGKLVVKGAKRHNLRNLDLIVPLGKLVCISGASGSGKSSLLEEIADGGDRLARKRRQHRGHKASNNRERAAKVTITGVARVPKIVYIDQVSHVSSRDSTPATFLGIFGKIRQIFSRLPLARQRGYTPAYFSLSMKGGRCEKCKGQGYILPAFGPFSKAEQPCNACNAKRYGREIYDVRYKGRNIAEVLGFSVAEAADFFSRQPAVRTPLEALLKAELGYIKLGQPTRSLSRGELQRLRLAKALAKKGKESCIFLIDEPTKGMHPSDIQRLILLWDELIEQGDSIVLVENKPEILNVSDWVVLLGPGGGPEGGNILFQGPPKK